jgi:hypothetical protein
MSFKQKKVFLCFEYSDEEYTPSMIIQHLDECKEDWMFDEYNKPEVERVPLPNPTKQFQDDLEYIKKYLREMEKEVEKELPRSLSPIESKVRELRPKEQAIRMVDGGLAEWPNCSRTFFPDRLTVHLKSCKPGKPLVSKKKKKINMRFQNQRKTKPVLKGLIDMMITGKIIEKAEEEEEDSDEQPAKKYEDEYEDDFDFDQYKEINDEWIEPKNAFPAPHLNNNKDKLSNKKEKCDVWNLLIPVNKFEKHIEEWSQPHSKKFVLNVKTIKFAERVTKKVSSKNTSGYSESFEGNYQPLIYSATK